MDTHSDGKKISNTLEQQRIWADTISRYNWINFLKIDIKDIKDKFSLNKDITLRLYGAMQTSKAGLTSMNIRTFMLPDSFISDWNNEK